MLFLKREAAKIEESNYPEVKKSKNYEAPKLPESALQERIQAIVDGPIMTELLGTPTCLLYIYLASCDKEKDGTIDAKKVYMAHRRECAR